jgi:hypothetical protein
MPLFYTRPIAHCQSIFRLSLRLSQITDGRPAHGSLSIFVTDREECQNNRTKPRQPMKAFGGQSGAVKASKAVTQPDKNQLPQYRSVLVASSHVASDDRSSNIRPAPRWQRIVRRTATTNADGDDANARQREDIAMHADSRGNQRNGQQEDKITSVLNQLSAAAKSANAGAVVAQLQDHQLQHQQQRRRLRPQYNGCRRGASVGELRTITDACTEHHAEDASVFQPSKSLPMTVDMTTWKTSTTAHEFDAVEVKPTIQQSCAATRKYASASMSRISENDATSHSMDAEVNERECNAPGSSAEVTTDEVTRAERGRTRTSSSKIGAADDMENKSLARTSKVSRFVSGERIPFRRRIFWHQAHQIKTKSNVKSTSNPDTKNNEVAALTEKTTVESSTGRSPATATLTDEPSAWPIRKQTAVVCQKRSACSLPTMTTTTTRRRRGNGHEQQQPQVKIDSKPADETIKLRLNKEPSGAAKPPTMVTTGVDPKVPSVEYGCGTGSKQSHLVRYRLTSDDRKSPAVDCNGACVVTSSTSRLTIDKTSASRRRAASADAAAAAIGTLQSTVDNTAASSGATVSATVEDRRLDVAFDGPRLLTTATGEEATASNQLHTAADRKPASSSPAIEVKVRYDDFRRLQSATDGPDTRQLSSVLVNQCTATAPPPVDHCPSACAASDAVQPLLRELLMAHDTRNQPVTLATSDGNRTSTDDVLGAKIVNIAAASAARSKAARIEAWLIDVNRHRIDDVDANSSGAEFYRSRVLSSALTLRSASDSDRRTSAAAQRGASCEMPSDKLATSLCVTRSSSPLRR